MLLLALAWGCSSSGEDRTAQGQPGSEQAPEGRSLLWVAGPLLDSALNIVQVPPAMRDITFGLVILAMLFLYGRAAKTRD